MMEQDEQTSARGDSEQTTSAERPHGYTLADAELDRVKTKSEQEDVLDPLALQDPTGAGVERVVAKIGLIVIVVIVVIILFAQVACKSIRLATVPDFTKGASQERLEEGLSNGFLWAGEIVRVSDDAEVTMIEDGVIEVEVTDDKSRTIDQVMFGLQQYSAAMAMNVFTDETIDTLRINVLAHVSEETGAITGAGRDPLVQVLTMTWARADGADASFTCDVESTEPLIVGTPDASGKAKAKS